jgi:N-acetylmuramic acid 6-phosphate etherase
MLQPTTEKLRAGEAIDVVSTPIAAAAFLIAQQSAIDAITSAVRDIDAGADAMAAAVRSGNSIIYAAAGSSGLMALADACELSGTFGIADGIVRVHMAGGVPVDGRMPGNTEDNTADSDMIGRSLKKGDVVIVLSVSGTTPYAVAIAKSARAHGGTVIGIANNPATELLDLADIAICLETPPEVIAGSTRLGAGTAQKATLNLMSSLMGIKLGHVYKGRMVNVIADNAKLIKRAVSIVSQIAGVSTNDAQVALDQSNGNAKTAILIASGCTLTAAQALLAAHDGQLGQCYTALKLNHDENV